MCNIHTSNHIELQWNTFLTLTHLLHELLIVLAAVDLPGSIERHGCRLVGLKAAGNEALPDRGTANAHWPSFIYTVTTPTQASPPSGWHGRCSPLSLWLSACWCGRLKTVSNVGRWPHDLEDTLINNWRATPLWIWQSWTLCHCSAGEKKKKRVGCLYGCSWQSLNWASFSSSIFSLSPGLCLAWQWVVKGFSVWQWQLELASVQRVVTQKRKYTGLETFYLCRVKGPVAKFQHYTFKCLLNVIILYSSS